jgi:hypothetical protein
LSKETCNVSKEQGDDSQAKLRGERDAVGCTRKLRRVRRNGAADAENAGEQAVSQSKFYCNTKALNPAERARHKLLTEKLVAQRTRIVETEKGYEFQYGPSVVSLEELTKWVAAESKCCPFFDVHIDLENEGALLCLRLTGEKGIKEFVRSEFSVPAAN